ncbi:hypothetical protein ACHAXS_014017 [Conticribra weissflogii]
MSNANSSESYLLLVEFVHKHLDFHDAELQSILDMHGIVVGTDCHFLPLPNSDTDTTADGDRGSFQNHSTTSKSKSNSNKRPFRILSFAWKSIGSKYAVCDEDPDSDAASPTRNGGSNDTVNLITALARCTLVRSVMELWGAGPSIDDCATSIRMGSSLRRHREGRHLRRRNIGNTKQNDSTPIKPYPERTWKITIHTLGSTYTRQEQNEMRSKFSFLQFPGPVQMKHPDDEYLFIREVELDAMGGAVYPRHCKGDDGKTKKELIPENDARPPLACYFGRVLGNGTLGRNWRGSNRLFRYSLKKRTYLGPTSMDSELSLIMTNLAQVRKGSFAFDPFVGTGSILLAAALRGARAFGTDIDLRVLRGRSSTENIVSNFKQYDLPPPELVRSDNSIYQRHFRKHLPLFDAIVTDPPYGIRAGARKSGSRRGDGEARPIAEEFRYDHVAQTRPYAVSDVMADLLNVAAMTLVMGGRLTYVIPSMLDFDAEEDLPRHDCLRVVSVCYQPLQTELGRRTVTMEKVKDYDERRREEYLEGTWVNGPQSAEKVANIRERLMEAARKKPGYEEKAAWRKQKRKETKEAKKRAKLEGVGRVAVDSECRHANDDDGRD